MVLRAADAVVGKLEAKESPRPAATATQRIFLGALAAQLRSAAGTILPAPGQEGVGVALGGLVARTLALVDAALTPEVALAGPIEEQRLLSCAQASGEPATSAEGDVLPA